MIGEKHKKRSQIGSPDTSMDRKPEFEIQWDVKYKSQMAYMYILLVGRMWFLVGHTLPCFIGVKCSYNCKTLFCESRQKFMMFLADGFMSNLAAPIHNIPSTKTHFDSSRFDIPCHHPCQILFSVTQCPPLCVHSIAMYLSFTAWFPLLNSK